MNLGNYDFLLRHYDLLSPTQQKMLENFISALPEAERYFARRKYIDGATVEQIAAEMCYTERNIYRIRRRVLEKLRIYMTSREVDLLARTMRRIV